MNGYYSSNSYSQYDPNSGYSNVTNYEQTSQTNIGYQNYDYNVNGSMYNNVQPTYQYSNENKDVSYNQNENFNAQNYPSQIYNQPVSFSSSTNAHLMPPTVYSTVTSAPSMPYSSANTNYYGNNLTDKMRNMSMEDNQRSVGMSTPSFSAGAGVVEQPVDLLRSKYSFSDINEEVTYTPQTHYQVNCDPSIMQCTLNMIPVDQNLLSKSRLPMGVHVQPFKDVDDLYVSGGPIVRCKVCRAYINPFVSLIDQQRRWLCNVCGRQNDIPDEFMYDPETKGYGQPSKRPELKHCTMEYIANADYTVRPPMPTTLVFCIDVSSASLRSGCLITTCRLLMENLDLIPGDSRTQIAFLTYDSSVQFYQLHETGYKVMSWPDVNLVELPIFDDLLVNMKERKEIIREFLSKLSEQYSDSYEIAAADTGNCFGFALQVAIKLVGSNGGRITFVNSSMPSVGPGALKSRPGESGVTNDKQLTKLLQPETEFYKTIALLCANDQISVDLFSVSRQYSDLATLIEVCRHSSGSLHYYGDFRAPTVGGNVNSTAGTQQELNLSAPEQLDFDRFVHDFTRYITRNIGFEAVMRTRFTKELEISSFYGNLFMRSPNVISLPVISPDSGFLIQFKHAGSLNEWNYAVIQAALLYTTSNSERRIRVHTLCLPITSRMDQVFEHANGPAIAGLIAKLAADRCISDGPDTVREAFVNSLVDPLRAYNGRTGGGGSGGRVSGSGSGLLCPRNLHALAPYVLALIRQPVFRSQSCPIDLRTALIDHLRSWPLLNTLRLVYPALVTVTPLFSNIPLKELSEVDELNYPLNLDLSVCTRLNLSNESFSRDGSYLLDCGSCLYLYVGASVPDNFLKQLFGPSIDSTSRLQQLYKYNCVLQLDNQETSSSLTNKQRVSYRRLNLLVDRISYSRKVGRSVCLVTPDSSIRDRVLTRLVEDRAENAMSYYEFLQSIRSSIYS